MAAFIEIALWYSIYCLGGTIAVLTALQLSRGRV